MDFSIAKCARCDKPFQKIRSPVCLACQPDEDRDFDKIRDVVGSTPNLKAAQAAELAGVTTACVLRMIDEGQIVTDTLLDTPKCGRCGAPAVGRAKRLCEKCLVELDRNVAANIRRMRQLLDAKRGVIFPLGSTARARAYQVHDTLRGKRRATPPPRTRVR